MRYIILLACFLCLLNPQNAWTQVDLVIEGFETDGEGVRYNSTTFSDCPVSSDYFIRTDINPFVCTASGFLVALTNVQGTWYWASEDPDPGAHVTLVPLDVSLYTSLEVHVYLATPRVGTMTWEDDDFVRIQYQLDGGGFATIGQFVGSAQFGGDLTEDADLDGIADPLGAVLDENLTEYSYSIPITGNMLDVRIFVDDHAGSEELGFDDIRVSGILSVQDPPVLANIEGTAVSYTEGDPATQITNTITVTDPDDANLASATITISAGFDASEDILAASPPGGSGITASYVAPTLTLSGSSSLANYQAALRSVTYQNNDNVNPSSATRTISFQANDGTDNSNFQTRNIDITTVVNAPIALPLCEGFETDGEGSRYTSNTFESICNFFIRTNSMPACHNVAVTGFDGSWFWASENVNAGGAAGFVELSPAIATGLNDFTVDILLGESPSGSSGWEPSDAVLIQYNMDGGSWVTVGAFYGTNPPTMPGTLVEDADLNGLADPGGTALTSVMQPFSFNFNATGTNLFVRVVVDQLGASEELVFDSICVSGVLGQAPPILANIEGAGIIFTEGDPPVQVSNTITIADADDTNMDSAKIWICSGFVPSEDELTFTPSGGVVGSYNSTTGILALDGNATIAEYESMLRSVAYQNTNVMNPSNVMREICFLVNDGEANSNQQSRLISILEVINGVECIPYTESFETDGEGLRYSSNTYADTMFSNCDFFYRIGQQPDCHADLVNGTDGMFFWASEDVVSPGNGNAAGELTMQKLVATDFTNLELSILVGTSNDDSTKWESDDNVLIQFNMDGGGWTTFGLFQGDNPGGGALRVDTDQNPATPGPYGATVINGMALPFTFTIPVVGDTLQVRILVDQDGGSEELVFDSIAVDGIYIGAPPVITCPVDPAPIEWTAGFNLNPVPPNTPQDPSIDTMTLGSPTVTTSGCASGTVVEFQDILSGPFVQNCPEIWVVTRTWSAMDITGATSTCVQTITFTDTTPPTITCPPDPAPIEWTSAFNTMPVGPGVPQDPSIDPGVTGTPVTSDNCSVDSLNYQDVLIGPSIPNCPELWIVERTWIVFDQCGLQDTCVQTFTLTDTTPPVIVCPANVIVECGNPVNPVPPDNSVPGLDTATAIDNCTLNPTITFSDEIVNTGQCPVRQIITRTWFAEDDCGNTSSCLQTISITDTSPPMITCPASPATVPFPAGFNTTPVGPGVPQDPSIDPSITGVPNASDMCGIDSVSFQDLIFGPNTSDCQNLWVVTRIWTATDSCGLIDTCHQTFAYSDSEPPNITCPPDSTFEWPAGYNLNPVPPNIPQDPSIDTAITGNPMVSDNFGIASVNFQDILIGPNPANCPNLWFVERTWTATDLCNNDSTCIQVFTYTDLTAPTLICPSNPAPIEWTADFNDTVVGPNTPQDPSIDPMIIGSPIVDDNCAVASVSYQDSLYGPSPANCPIVYTVVRTWTAVDFCDNSDFCTQVISLTDLTAPMITGPADTTVNCEVDTSVASLGVAVATDNCDPMPIISHTDMITPGNCPNNFIISRTWMAVDACGNPSMVVQTITVQDTTPPVATFVPPDTIIDCDSDIDAVLAQIPIFMDNCDPDVPAFGSAVFIQDPDCPQASTFIFGWTGTDTCGNSITVGRTVMIQDTTSPMAICQDVTVQLDDMGQGGVVAEDINNGSFDNCGMITIDMEAMDFNCGDLGDFIVTLTVEDECDNVSTCNATVTVEDVTPPTIDCPGTINVFLDPGECNEIVNWQISAMDNCEAILTTGFLGTTFIDNNGFAGNMFDLTNIGSSQITITMFDIHLETASGSTANMEVYHTTSAVSYAGLEFAGAAGASNAAWTYLGAALATSAGPGMPSALPVGGLQIMPGETFGIYIYQTDGSDIDYTNGTLTVNDGMLQFDSGIGYGDGVAPAFTGPAFANRIWNGNVHYLAQTSGDVVLEQTEGPPPGSIFEGGTTTDIEYVATDFSGNTAICQFQVIVNDFENYTDVLACNDDLNISVDQNCSAFVGADMILEGGPYKCYDDYFVEIEGVGSGMGGVLLTAEHVGGWYSVTITDPETGNSCWSTIHIEDKFAPMLTCISVELPCTADTDPVEGDPIIGTVSLTDNPGLPIGPNAGTVTTHEFNVVAPANAKVTDVDVRIDLDHTFSGDLDVVLIGPDGSEIVLAQDVCGAANDWENVVFDDDAATAVGSACTGGSPALVGPVQPEEALSAFNGIVATGTWTLQITDDAGGDAGVLNVAGIDVGYFVALPYTPIVHEACGSTDLVHTDVVTGDECSGLVIERTWTATDGFGNTGTCVQIITVTPLDLDDLLMPMAYEEECGGSTDPSVTGWPTVGGIPIEDGNICNVYTTWEDKPLPDCGGGTKLVRHWLVLDWCTQEVVKGTQVIKLSDNVGPVLTCPENVTVSTDTWTCYADVNLPAPTGEDACNTPFTSVPSASQGVIVEFGGQYRVDDLPVGETIITWTAEDECGNTSTCSYTITVIDDIPPVPLCDEHTIVSLTNDGDIDEGLTKIPAEVFDDGSYDNCGPVTLTARRVTSCIDFDWTTNGACVDATPNIHINSADKGTAFGPCVPFVCCDVGAGPIMVELRVQDSSLNVNFCMVEVEVQDKLDPIISAPPSVDVSCEFWFAVEETGGSYVPQYEDPLTPVFGRVLDAYEYDQSDRQYVVIDDPGSPLSQPYNWGLEGWADDNCNVEVTVRVQVWEDCSGDNLSGKGAPVPPYATRLVKRTFKAEDGQGNSSTAAQFIWVIDYDPFEILDWTCVNQYNDGVIWPCDETYGNCPVGGIVPNYPTIFDDNCSLIGVTYEDTRFDFVDDVCYKILREWTVIDWCQYESHPEEQGIWRYIQVIKVIDSEGPQADAPPLVELCAADSNISLPANNQVFLGENNPLASSCSVHIILEHEVSDFCSDVVTYDVKFYPNNDPSYYMQVLKKTDIAIDSNGTGTMVFDSRSSSLLGVRLNGLDYNSPYCSNWPAAGGSKDYHRVLWSMEDGCGNTTTLEYLLRLEDCKAPSPVCVSLSSVVMPSSGEVTIWAADFNASSFDDCTPAADLLYSFSGDSYQPSRTFDCAAIEENGGTGFPIEIWVADNGNDQNCNGFRSPNQNMGILDGIEWSERNKDFCSTWIIIDDNTGVCGGGGMAGGLIETEELESVENVTVTLMDELGLTMQEIVTGGSGTYQFVNPLLSYTIEPNRDDNHVNGVSTLDLVRIQKHLLGIEPFASPYKMIAADANNSESVTALDLVEIRKLILGLNLEFPNNESWRFVDASYAFPDISDPWPFDEIIELESGYNMEEDFMAVKIGDVNGTVTANATQIEVRESRSILTLHALDRAVSVGEEVRVEVTAGEFASIFGYQFTLRTEGLKLTSVDAGLIDMDEANVGVHKYHMTASWHRTEAVDAQDGEVLFTLGFVATMEGQLSEMMSIGSEITEAEAYRETGSDAEIMDLELTFGDLPVVPTGVEFALYQNEPNPFRDMTTIGFTLPEAMDAKVTVFDVTGRVIKIVEGEYEAGYNEVQLMQHDLGTTGVFYYRLDAGELSATGKANFSASKKLIIIE